MTEERKKQWWSNRAFEDLFRGEKRTRWEGWRRERTSNSILIVFALIYHLAFFFSFCSLLLFERNRTSYSFIENFILSVYDSEAKRREETSRTHYYYFLCIYLSNLSSVQLNFIVGKFQRKRFNHHRERICKNRDVHSSHMPFFPKKVQKPHSLKRWKSNWITTEFLSRDRSISAQDKFDRDRPLVKMCGMYLSMRSQLELVPIPNVDQIYSTMSVERRSLAQLEVACLTGTTKGIA